MTTDDGAKKQKLDVGEVNTNSAWKLVFDQTQQLRMLMDIIHNLIQRVQIQVIKNESFSGIIIESVDSKKVCLIIAKLECEVICDESAVQDCVDEFCIDSETMSTCLRSIASHYSVDIEKAGDSICMKSYETMSNTYITRFKLPTLLHDAQRIRLDDFEYDNTVEMDLVTLRSIIKNCIALKGENVNIVIKESEDGRDANKVVCLKSEGSAVQEHTFVSTSADDGNGGFIIRTTDAISGEGSNAKKMIETYNMTFMASYLNLFMKSMERQLLTLKLSPGMPLIITYPLGTGESNIRFVLAARVEG